eukprot:TCONS_00049268-protein
MAFTYRMDGVKTFVRFFEKYKEGFGKPPEDYYLGNENLHQLTKSGEYELYYLTDARDTPTTYHGWYGQFSVSDEADFYRLSIGDFREGTNTLAISDSMQFSAHEVGKDKAGAFCALNRQGGFWYNACGSMFPHSKANGIRPPGECMGLYPGNSLGMVCTKTFQIFMRKKR